MDEPETGSARQAEPKKAKPKKGWRSDKLQSESRKMAELALETLGDIMRGKGQASARLAAAREVLHWGYGRISLRSPEAKAQGAAPYTVVVQRFSDPQDPAVEDFD